MDLQQLPIDKIYLDNAFNCRGNITPFDVSELAKGIQAVGLKTPISVHKGPWKDKPNEPLPPGFDYRIIAGHRRFTAYKVLGATYPNDPRWKTIYCTVECEIAEIEARILNLSENLDRQQLNILQEAKAMEALYKAGVARESVADRLKKTGSWVQTRFNLLALPADVQQEVAAGNITHVQIKQLYSIRHDTDAMYEAVRRIKDAKSRGEKVGHVGKKRKKPTTEKRQRDAADCLAMLEILAKAIGYGLHTRILAWASGNVPTNELFDDVVAEAERLGRPKFYPPHEF